MKVLGHDDVSVDYEAVLLARFFQDAQEKCASFGRVQLRLAVVATAGDEMQVMVAVIATQPLGHPVRVRAEFQFDCDPALSRMVTNPLIGTKRECVGHPRAQSRDAFARLPPAIWSGAVEASSTRFLPLCLAR